MPRNRLHTILLIFLLGLLWLPLFQKAFTLKFEKPLMGDYQIQATTPFNRANWFNDSFQQSINTWSNESFGFRPYLVRLHNQIFMWLYNKAFAKDVIVGKDNYLFEKKYIDSYLGNDFRGKVELQKEIDKLKFIADTLKKINVNLIVMITPGKGYFYPEFIPNNLMKDRVITNYEYYIAKFKESGISFVDFNQSFVNQKGKTQYPLYPKTGVHWSTWGMLTAADSMLKFMESVSGLDIPEMVLDSIEVTSQPRGYDQDIEDAMNLLFPISKPDYAYPKCRFVSKFIHQKPTVITIGDSFWWGIYYSGIPENVFASHEFLYYNMQSYIPGRPEPAEVDAATYIQKIKSSNFVILQTSEGLMQSFPWGFSDKLYAHFNSADFDLKVEAYIREIKNDPAWLEAIKKKALENNVDLEEMIRKDAIYMVESAK